MNEPFVLLGTVSSFSDLVPLFLLLIFESIQKQRIEPASIN